jgi:acetyl esterase/lipase
MNSTSLRRAGVAALAVLLVAASASCFRPRPRPPVTTMPPTTAPVTTAPPTSGPSTTVPSQPGRYVQEVFPQIETLAKDEVYKTAAEAPGIGVAAKDLRINVYAPQGDTLAKRPVYIWQFGGGFVFGDRNQLDSRAQAAAKRGFIGVSIDYRLSTAPGLQILQAAREDAADAIEWLTARSEQWRLDPGAIISGGVSAGAINSIHLITMAPAGGPIPIIGAVSLSGTSYVPARAGGPPVIMFSGNQDTIVGFDLQVSFCNGYKAAGNVCEQHIYDAGHGLGNTADITEKSNTFVLNLLRAKGY